MKEHGQEQLVKNILPFCEFEVHCERCISDKKWRDGIARDLGPFKCPIGKSEGSNVKKEIKNKKDKDIKDKKPTRKKTTGKCVHMEMTNRKVRESSCNCSRNRIICNNEEMIKKVTKESYDMAIEDWGGFPHGWSDDKCVSTKCPYFEGEIRWDA